MRKLLTAVLPLLFLSMAGNATVRRVGFIATIQQVSGLDYGNFQAAHDASSAGDTIQLYPSTSTNQTYSGTVSKPIVVIGPGYYSNTYTLSGTERFNNNLQIIAGQITSCSFLIDNGSAGSIFIGLTNPTFTTVDQVNMLSNITIRRCFNVYLSIINSAPINNWTVTQCYGVRLDQSAPAGGFTGDRSIDNLTISNSVIYGAINLNTSPSGAYAGNRILNCNFISGASLSLNNATFTIQNCIFETQSFAGITNVTWIKNITANSATSNPITNTGSNSGNQYSILMSNVYVGYPTNTVVSGTNTFSNDGRFALKTGSPAINGGFLPGTTTATDCGIYGGNGGTGTSPYVLSGIPPIPTFTRINAPNAVTPASGNYTITISIRSNN